MEKLYTVVFLVTAAIFIYFLVFGNELRIETIQKRLLAANRDLTMGYVPFDDKPSIVFKPLFTEDGIR
jgi:hypothetical protein